MARTTHKRLDDHRGTDLDTNVVLDGATATYGDGDGLHAVISDMDDRIAGGADLLVGDSRNFDASNGNWTNSGGTLTWDNAGGFGWPLSSVPSLKLVTTATNQYVEVPVPGTFLADHMYAATIAFTTEEQIAGGMQLIFGLIGTDSVTLEPVVLSSVNYLGQNALYAIFVLKWRPSADRTGVKIRLNRGGAFASAGTKSYHIGHAQVIEISPFADGVGGVTFGYDEPINQPHSGFALQVDHSTIDVTVGAGRSSSSLRGIRFLANGGVSLTNTGADSGLSIGGLNAAGVWAEHTPGDLADAGFNIEAGSDLVGMYISEKNSTTVQLYPESGYVAELRDRSGTDRWVVNDGTTVTPLSNLTHVLVGTADPSAGGGVAHPQPAMYLRNNSGVTELWLATGAGATAWAKQTSP